MTEPPASQDKPVESCTDPLTSTQHSSGKLDKGVVVLKKPSAVICDIEGTTTSVRFWEECLGPMVWLNTRECLKNEWDQQETKDVVIMLKKRMRRTANNHRNIFELPDENSPTEAWISQIFRYFKYSVEHQRFTEDIVSLQVLVSFYCYKNKICQGHVYDDAKNAVKRWRENNISVGVFSSGIPIVQKMLFCYSNFGNITQYINEFFSSSVDGEKDSSQSYIRVVRQIGAVPNTVVYVSDSPKELAAANAAGLYPVLMIRAHNVDLLKKVNKIPFKFIQSFNQLRFFAPEQPKQNWHQMSLP